MAREILSVKLCELDDRISRLQGRIHLSESSDFDALDDELRKMEKECSESRQALSDKLHHSKSDAVMSLAGSYDAVEDAIRQLKRCDGKDRSADEKILLAEYSLDFALLAAETALYKALEAIKAFKDEQRSA